MNDSYQISTLSGSEYKARAEAVLSTLSGSECVSMVLLGVEPKVYELWAAPGTLHGYAVWYYVQVYFYKDVPPDAWVDLTLMRYTGPYCDIHMKLDCAWCWAGWDGQVAQEDVRIEHFTAVLLARVV